MDSGGIGNDDFGAVACDFYVAVEQAGIAAVDLVDDHAGCAGGEPGVALNPTSGLGVGIGSAVVENGGRRSGKRTFYRTQASPDPGK